VREARQVYNNLKGKVYKPAEIKDLAALLKQELGIDMEGQVMLVTKQSCHQILIAPEASFKVLWHFGQEVLPELPPAPVEGVHYDVKKPEDTEFPPKYVYDLVRKGDAYVKREECEPYPCACSGPKEEPKRVIDLVYNREKDVCEQAPCPCSGPKEEPAEDKDELVQEASDIEKEIAAARQDNEFETVEDIPIKKVKKGGSGKSKKSSDNKKEA
jgi:hypothetical protein